MSYFKIIIIGSGGIVTTASLYKTTWISAPTTECHHSACKCVVIKHSGNTNEVTSTLACQGACHATSLILNNDRSLPQVVFSCRDRQQLLPIPTSLKREFRQTLHLLRSGKRSSQVQKTMTLTLSLTACSFVRPDS